MWWGGYEGVGNQGEGVQIWSLLRHPSADQTTLCNFHCQAPNISIVILTSLTLTMWVLEEQRHSNRNHYVTALCSDPLVYLSGGEGRREGREVWITHIAVLEHWISCYKSHSSHLSDKVEWINHKRYNITGWVPSHLNKILQKVPHGQIDFHQLNVTKTPPIK